MRVMATFRFGAAFRGYNISVPAGGDELCSASQTPIFLYGVFTAPIFHIFSPPILPAFRTRRFRLSEPVFFPHIFVQIFIPACGVKHSWQHGHTFFCFAFLRGFFADTLGAGGDWNFR